MATKEDLLRQKSNEQAGVTTGNQIQSVSQLTNPQIAKQTVDLGKQIETVNLLSPTELRNRTFTGQAGQALANKSIDMAKNVFNPNSSILSRVGSGLGAGAGVIGTGLLNAAAPIEGLTNNVQALINNPINRISPITPRVLPQTNQVQPLPQTQILPQPNMMATNRSDLTPQQIEGFVRTNQQTVNQQAQPQPLPQTRGLTGVANIMSNNDFSRNLFNNQQQALNQPQNTMNLDRFNQLNQENTNLLNQRMQVTDDQKFNLNNRLTNLINSYEQDRGKFIQNTGGMSISELLKTSGGLRSRKADIKQLQDISAGLLSDDNQLGQKRQANLQDQLSGAELEKQQNATKFSQGLSSQLLSDQNKLQLTDKDTQSRKELLDFQFQNDPNSLLKRLQMEEMQEQRNALTPEERKQVARSVLNPKAQEMSLRPLDVTEDGRVLTLYDQKSERIIETPNAQIERDNKRQARIDEIRSNLDKEQNKFFKDTNKINQLNAELLKLSSK